MLTMKKINILLIISFFISSLFLFAENSFAQNNQSLFDLSTPIRQEKISASAKTTLAVSLFPFTTLVIKPGSFQENVTLYVYPGVWNNLKTALPKDQSPISSYYLIFKSKDSTVYPSIPLTIESYNNYINTDTFFYPIASSGEIDKENQKNWPGHIKVRTELPVNDSGFIVAANKDISPNDSSLLISQTPSQAPERDLTPVPSQNNIFTLSRLSSLLPTVVTLIVVISLISIVFWILWKKQK